MPADIDQQARRCKSSALTRDAEPLVKNARGEKRDEHTEDAHTLIVDPGETWMQLEAKGVAHTSRDNRIDRDRALIAVPTNDAPVSLPIRHSRATPSCGSCSTRAR
jgi:hypothetical protein